MSNITLNRLNLTLAQPAITAINAAIADVKTNLPLGGEFALAEGEEETLLSMNVDNRQFVSDVISEMQISGGILPSFISLDYVENDATLFDQLDDIESRLMNVVRIVRDLKRMAAHEAYATALAVYKFYEMAAAGGIPGAKESYDRLKARFKGQGPGQPGAPEQNA